MKLNTLWRRISASTLAMFIFESFVSGILLILLFGPHIRRWGVFATYCLGLGLILTIIAKVLVRRSIRAFGLTSVQQAHALKDAIHAGIPPKDKALLDALPRYLFHSGEQIDRLRKDYWKSLVIFGFLAIASIFTHIIWSVVFLLFIGLTVYIHNGLDKREAKLRTYCSILEKHGIAIVRQIETLQKKHRQVNSKSRGWDVPS